MEDSQLMTLDLRLNIICFDIPYPADYGGAMEEYYKLKSLHKLGIKIHLHCFKYGDRNEQSELEKFCEKVFYYERKRNVLDIFSAIPFIVKSRMNNLLLENLLSNTYPILFDGTHTTGFINHPSLNQRKKIVRLHNIEWIYYNVLFHAAVTPKEKVYYFSEYKKLRKYDKQLEFADALVCLSEIDRAYYQEKFQNKVIKLISVFHQNESIKSKTGNGNYIFYHGNLSVLDNYSAIIDLLNGKLNNSPFQIVLAGKNPDPVLVNSIKNKANIKLIGNPDTEQMKDLILNAHICLAIANNPSGIKLKLINSIYYGRHIFCNESAYNGSGLDELIVNIECENFSDVLSEYMKKEFSVEDIEKRKKILSNMYNNDLNALKIANIIFDDKIL